MISFITLHILSSLNLFGQVLAFFSAVPTIFSYVAVVFDKDERELWIKPALATTCVFVFACALFIFVPSHKALLLEMSKDLDQYSELAQEYIIEGLKE